HDSESLSLRTRVRLIKGRCSWWRGSAVGVAVVVSVGAAVPVIAQTGSPGESPEQSRPLILSPTFRLADVGWDDNVFRVNKADNPIGDFTATLCPAIRASLRAGRVQAVDRS